MLDFDGNGVALPASSSGMCVLTYDQVENKENSPNNFHVPAKRWVEFHGPVLANKQGDKCSQQYPRHARLAHGHGFGGGVRRAANVGFSVWLVQHVSPAPRLEMFEEATRRRAASGLPGDTSCTSTDGASRRTEHPPQSRSKRVSALGRCNAT